MVFSSFTRTESGNQIFFKNSTPIEYVEKLKYFKDDSSGLFTKKEFRWSFNENYWASWTELNQGNISSIDIKRNRYLFLEIKYTKTIVSSSVSTFEVNYNPLTSTERISCPATQTTLDAVPTPTMPQYGGSQTCDPYIKEISNADTLCDKDCDYYLTRSNHKGQQPISSIKDLQRIINNMYNSLSTIDFIVADGENIGDGEISIFKEKTNENILEFRTISASEGITIETIDDTVYIAFSGQSGYSTEYIDGSLLARDLIIGSDQYDSNLFINDGDNHSTSLSNLDQIMGLIAPGKPETLSGKTLSVTGTTAYSAILPSGLASSWYMSLSPGNTITDYIIDTTFTLTTPNYTSDPATFRAGLWQDPSSSGLLIGVINGVDEVTYDMTAGVGSSNISLIDVSGALFCSSVGGYGGAENNFWRKGQAYINVTNQREGQVTYAIKHSEALTSNVASFRYDDVASTPAFSVSPTAAITTDNSVYLSGIAHFGSGTVFNVSYTGAAGIFRKAYHSTNVSRLSSTFGSNVNINPSVVPDVDDAFPVSSSFTFNTPNQASGASSATIVATLFKPNTSTPSTVTLTRRANTYSTSRATTTIEYFTDESRRLRDVSSGADTVWVSSEYTIFNPGNGAHAQVQNGTLRYPVSADYGAFAFSGDKLYIRRFTKSSASSGAITFAGFNPLLHVSAYGSGDVNVLIHLTDQGLYFDLGREFGIGGGAGLTMATAISAFSSRSSTAINWTLGTYSTGNEILHNGTYALIVIFRNTNRTMTQITSS